MRSDSGSATLIVNPVAGGNEAPEHLATIERRLRDRFGRLEVAMTARSRLTR